MKTLFLDDVHQSNVDLVTTELNTTNLPKSVLTIGNFDGVHLGHQAMLQQLHKTANENGLKTMVMVFEPQPREYFAAKNGDAESAPPRLTNQHEKLAKLAEFNIDTVVVAKFDSKFRSLSATEFADMLVHRLNVSALVLGDDFKFGHDRTGNSQFLRDYGLPVTNLHTITDTVDNVTADDTPIDTRISSTRIRECLQAGDIKMANHLLGYDYSITGEVLSGDAIGRTLNFPTANIALHRVRPALHGIYGVDVVVSDDKTGETIENGLVDLAKPNQAGIKGLRPHSLFGTANIGTRPSVDKPHEWRLEVFFPEFAGDLYGKTLNVRFLHYLHGERHYDGLVSLKKGIAQDVDDLIDWRQAQA